MSYRRGICAKRELLQRNLHNTGPQAPSAHRFTWKSISPDKSYSATAPNHAPWHEVWPSSDEYYGTSTPKSAWRYGYINHPLPIMTGLRATETEWQICSQYENSLWTRYVKIRTTISLPRSWSILSTPLHLSDPFSPEGGGTNTDNQQTSHQYKLNLVIS
jgi:hypothetical protein